MNDPERAVAAYENALRQNPYSENTLTVAANLCKTLEKHGKVYHCFSFLGCVYPLESILVSLMKSIDISYYTSNHNLTILWRIPLIDFTIHWLDYQTIISNVNQGG